ncbi:Protein NSTP-5 a, partial [Aphelenchoides avenae]
MSDCLQTKKDLESGSVSLATQKRKLNKAIALKCASLLALLFHNAGQVVFTRYASTRPDRERYLKTVAVLFGEFIKLTVSALVYFAVGHGWEKSTAGLRYYLIDDWRGMLKTGVASATFFTQNVLFFVALEKLDSGTYMLTSQSRILATAIFAVLILKRKLSTVQWLSLVVLCVGIGAVQVSMNYDGEDDLPLSNATTETFLNATTSPGSWTVSHLIASHENQMIGLLAVLVASTLSGFSGVYVEKILKTTDVGVLMQNIQLALMTIPIACLTIA